MGLFGRISGISIQKGRENPSYSSEEYTGITTSVKICMGICEGYDNKNEEVKDFEKYLQNKLEKIAEDLGFYISFIIYETKTIYKKEWGCPDGGEKTYNLEATRNPVFNSDDTIWRDQVLQVIRILKNDLKQSTVTLQFIPVEIVYMKSEKGE